MVLVVVVALQIWVALVVAIMCVYAVRHWMFTLNRLAGRQRLFHHDILDGRMPTVSVLIPMHNEEKVAAAALDAVMLSDYPLDLMEVIPVDDHSDDGTADILRGYARQHPTIKPLYRRTGDRGKSNALNDGLAAATHDIVLVFDADYSPGRGLVRELAAAFFDPEVGAVMGRVVPRNTASNFLTRLLDLERTGGYQVDQQARFNLDLLPQYGGTVGGFRRSIALFLGGFDPDMLAEDTEFTLRLFAKGWKIAYANRAECYEEVPETWEARFRQLRRWARGHTRAMIRHWRRIAGSNFLTPRQRLDAMLLMGIYLVPPLLLSGLAANALLFLMAAVPLVSTVLLSVFVVAYNAFGNFAPLYEIGAGVILDGKRERLLLLPYLYFLFVFNSWTVSIGVVDAVMDSFHSREPVWEKTERFAA